MSRRTAIKEDPSPVLMGSSQIADIEEPTSPLTELGNTPPHDTPTPPNDVVVMDTDSTSSKTVIDGKIVNKTLDTSKTMSEGARITFNSAGPSRGGETLLRDAMQVVKKSSSMGYDMLGEDMRDMVNTINQLRMKGVEDLGLPLPRIAVIGNQSAGKSSLIEAISGIRVPRYAGTCTRCPLEITLTEDTSPLAPWNCKVSLRFHKAYNPKKKGDPWTEIQHTQHPFMSIDDPENVEAVIIRAQLAILNPSRHWGDFINMPVQIAGNTATTEVPFSPNVICMEITGNNVPNLSFIDLPGIIHVTERKEEEYLIKLVRNLVEGYIKQEDCLILLAMTMKDDAVNQSAAQMARKLGPNRTIGALTKPDTVLGGEHDQWIKILRGHEHRLPHGYFVTRQPSQQQLLKRMSHPEARRLEDDFFNGEDPWNTELADLSERFGTVNLQKYLSKQLANLIRQRLPAIIRNVQNQSAQVQMQLEKLPPPPANSLRQVLRQDLDKYFYRLYDTIDGRGDDNKFSYEWRKIAAKLKADLIALRPRLNPDENSPRNPNSPFTLSAARASSMSLFGSFSSTPSTPNKRKRPGSHDDPPDGSSSDPFNAGSSAEGPPPRKRAAIESRTPSRKVISVEDDEVLEADSVTDTPAESSQSKAMHLHEIHEILEVRGATGIPGIVDHKAVEILSKMHIRLWDGPIKMFINEFDTLLYTHAHTTFASIFSPYELSPLYSLMTGIIDEFHTIMMTKIQKSISKCFRIEAECIYTMQDRDWNREHDNWKQDNKRRRKRAVEEQLAIKQQRAQERHNQAGRKGKVEVIPPEGPDPYQRELDTFTHTQAYLGLARRRFGDTVMMRMIRGIFTKYTVQGTFKEHVEQQLGLRELGEDEQERKCRELMVEDPAKERMRSSLVSKKELLDKAWMDLEPYQAFGGV
ncbi:uncharacterized protein DFL_000527 [Arthrobotrys flagrans]|uniref:GED domain-containing protein n=1 Tax=Arthrobotrys flagrans TaxID=97331 RepID=A0A437AE14_ARTFL|nr:hypothetical protein DFL_000527 [Arthrobotrys flagrans]